MNVYKNTIATPDGCELVLVEDGEHQNRVEYGDILFTQSSETLEEVGLSSVWLHKASPFLNSFCFGFHFAEKGMINPRFIAYSLRTSYMREKIIREGQGATRYNLSSNRLKPIKLVYPSYQEQSRIANLMSHLEKRIEKQQELICTLKKYKRGVFEAYISKKIRLSNRGSSYGDWKWVTISEIGKFFGGLSGKTKDDFGHGEDEFITYMNVYKNAFATEDGIMPVNIRTGEKQNRIQYGDILFTQSSETIEEVGLSSVWLHDSNPYLNSFCMALRPNSLMQFNPKYLGYIMRSKSVREQIMKEGQGISRINLSGNRILNVGFWCPSLDEQNKIVEIMERLDHICSLSDEKLSSLKSMKVAFMQQLFI